MPDIQPNFTPDECLRQLEEAYLANFWQDEVNTYRKLLALPEQCASLATRLRVSRYLNAMQVAVMQAKLLAAIDTARITGDETPLQKYAPYFARFETIDYETYVEAREDVLRSLMGAARKPYPRAASQGNRQPGPKGPGGRHGGDDSPSLELQRAQPYQYQGPTMALMMGQATIDNSGNIVRIPTPDNPNPKPFPQPHYHTTRAPKPHEPGSGTGRKPSSQADPAGSAPPETAPAATGRAAPTHTTRASEPQPDDTMFEDLVQLFPAELQGDLDEFGRQNEEWMYAGKRGMPPAYPASCHKFLEENAHTHPLLKRELEEVRKDKLHCELLAMRQGPGGGRAPDA